VLDGHINEVDQ